jgi:hypothetical protein
LKCIVNDIIEFEVLSSVLLDVTTVNAESSNTSVNVTCSSFG